MRPLVVRSWINRPTCLPLACTLWLVLCTFPTLLAEPPKSIEAGSELTADEQFFVEQVQPMLREHCYACHSHESGDSSGNLMLDSLAGMLNGGSRGATIVPSQPDQSILLRAVLYNDTDLQMPPDARMPDDQIAVMRQWIAAGAAMPAALRGDLNAVDNHGANSLQAAVENHWAYQAPQPWSAVADAGDAISGNGVIDAIVLSQLSQAGLSLSPAADRATLLRRLSYDLTGLPPGLALTRRVLADPRSDEVVLPELIEQLLAAPAFGERWARFWMDVSRYADNKGYVFQEDREYPEAHRYRSWLIDAFNHDMPYDAFVTKQLAADLQSEPAEATADLPALGFLTLGRRFLNNRNDIIDDRMDVVSRGLMGMTLACARCHDHKFDPLTQADYYAMFGVFLNTDEPGGEPWPHRLAESGEARQSFILIRGSPGNRGDKVPRRFVSFLAPEELPFGEGSGRVDLAAKIVATDNPLTSRVMANRIWLQLTGSSLTESPSDLGLRAPQPVQMALLDQLAISLAIDGRWSMKGLIRTIVSSRVYQQLSAHRDDAFAVDPENTLYWKMNRRRLDFEGLRDTLLTRVGQLDQQLYGPSEKIAAPPYSQRRTVYAYIDRQNLPQIFRTFDLASPDNHTPVRAQTSVPQQGLYLLNSDFVAQLAEQLAARAIAETSSTDGQQAGWMFTQVFGRQPTAQETTLLNDFLKAASVASVVPTDTADTTSSPVVQLAGALLATNELAYVD